LLWLANNTPADELPSLSRVDSNLLALYSRSLREGAAFDQADQTLFGVPVEEAFSHRADGVPLLSIKTDDAAGLAERVDALGYEIAGAVDGDAYGIVDVYAPVKDLTRILSVEGVNNLTISARPVTAASQVDQPEGDAVPRVGSVTSEWDLLSGAEQLRRIRSGLDGSIIDFGVMSDSINRVSGGVSTSQANGNLPTGSSVQILDDFTGSNASDEGRAMAELMYDIAPASDFIYHTAFEGLANFAQGIDDLRVAGADVIVDDIGYAQDPAFQDGIVTQAVDDVYLDHDVLYFSSAGNANGETDFDTWSEGTNSNDFHAWDGSGDERLDLTLDPGESIRVWLQWDDPWGAALRDFDLLVYANGNNTIVASSTTNNNGILGIGRTDPYEFLTLSNPSSSSSTSYDISIRYIDGDSPGGTRFFLGTFDMEADDAVDNDWGGPAVYGHSNARFGFGIGAAPWFNPNTIEAFSSRGGIPVVRSDSGADITPVFRQNPAFVGADGTSTAVPGFGNFFGTSAAAPNVAAIAGLLQEANGGARSLTWTEARDLLRDSAVDLGSSGYDSTWGWGRVDGLHAGILADGPFSNESYVELNQFGDGTFRADLISNTDLDRVFYAFDNAGFATTTVDAPVYDVAMQVFQTSNESLIGLDSENRERDNVSENDPSVSWNAAIQTEYRTTVFAEEDIDGISAADNDANVTINGPSAFVQTLSFNASGVGSLGASIGANDADYFQFTVPATYAGGPVTFTADPTTAGLNPVLSLYDASGNLVQRVDAGSTDVTETLTRSNLDRNASYVLRVGPANGASTGSFTVSADFDLRLPTSSTTSENAVIVPFGPTGSSPDVQGGDANINFAGDVDYFFFGRDVPLGDLFTIDVRDTLGGQDPIAAVYNSDTGALVAFSDDDGPDDDAQIVFTPAAGQRYTLAVADSGEATGDFIVTVDYGTGIFLGQDIPLDSDGNADVLLGSGIAPGGETFMYRTTVPNSANGAATFSVTPDTGDNAEIYVFDDQGDLIGSDRLGGVGATESVTLTGLGQGREYYITVLPQNYDAALSNGNVGGTVSVDFDVVTAPPTPTAPLLQGGSDTGISSTDNITSDRTPQLVGSLSSAFAGNTIRIFREGIFVGSGTVSPIGIYSVTLPQQPQGTFDYTATASVTPSGPQSPASPPLTVTIDATAPELVFFDFLFDNGPQDHRFFVDFNESTNGLAVTDPIFLNTTTNTNLSSGDFDLIPGTFNNDLVYNPTSGSDFIPDGNYTFRLNAGLVTDVAGNGNNTITREFFFLSGDANRDRTVDLADFGILRANFGSGIAARFSEGDFNYDGTVDLADFGILRASFGTTLVDPNAVSLFDDDAAVGSRGLFE
ncbi:MAG: S8 family serine peptidase, partial [Planctomycetota bacterium]